MRRPLIALTAVAASGTLALSACAGGSSDVVAQPGSTAAGAAATSTINLYAYAVPKVAFDVLIPAFQKTDAGKGAQFQQSYGASGDQSRKVAAGAEADFVNFSVEPDVTRRSRRSPSNLPPWTANAPTRTSLLQSAHGTRCGSCIRGRAPKSGAS